MSENIFLNEHVQKAKEIADSINDEFIKKKVNIGIGCMALAFVLAKCFCIEGDEFKKNIFLLIEDVEALLKEKK